MKESCRSLPPPADCSGTSEGARSVNPNPRSWSPPCSPADFKSFLHSHQHRPHQQDKLPQREIVGLECRSNQVAALPTSSLPSRQDKPGLFLSFSLSLFLSAKCHDSCTRHARAPARRAATRYANKLVHYLLRGSTLIELTLQLGLRLYKVFSLSEPRSRAPRRADAAIPPPSRRDLREPLGPAPATPGAPREIEEHYRFIFIHPLFSHQAPSPPALSSIPPFLLHLCLIFTGGYLIGEKLCSFFLYFFLPPSAVFTHILSGGWGLGVGRRCPIKAAAATQGINLP